MSTEIRPRDLTRLTGVALLVSTLLWWLGLRAWANAQVGHLDVDAVGSTPFLWFLLIALAGLALVSHALPRRGANVATGAAFLLAALALAIPNVAANLDDGISPAGWLVAGLSIAQATAFILVLLGRRRQPWDAGGPGLDVVSD